MDEEKNQEKTEEAVEEAKEAAEKAEEAAEEAKEAVEEAKEVVEEATEASEKAAEEQKEEKAPVSAPEPKKEIKVTGKLADIIKDIEKMSVLELAELVKALEDRFGVSAAPTMVGVPTGATPAAGEGAAEEGQTTFNVILADSGANKIGVIKAVRELVPTLGLKEAKDLVDSAPKPVLEGIGKDAANEAKQKMEAAGAKVDLQ